MTKIKRRFDLPVPDETGVLMITLVINGVPKVFRVDSPAFRTAIEAEGKVGLDL